MSFATASCDLWQNEQRRESSEPFDVFIDISTPGTTACCKGRHSISLHLNEQNRFNQETPAWSLSQKGPAFQPGLPSLPLVTLTALTAHNVVDQAIFFSLCRVHDEVAIGVTLDLFERLAGVLGLDLVHHLAQTKDLA